MLDPMPYDAAAAMRADRRQHMDRAFEAVEDNGAAAHLNLETLVVVIAALIRISPWHSPVAVMKPT